MGSANRFILIIIFFATFGFNAGSAVNEEPKKLVIIGDSISEGYGVAKENAYPTLLESKIKTLNKAWIVVNASIGGSTSASAQGRVKWQTKSKPDLLLLALGANDGLRGLKISDMERNLNEAVVLAKKAGIKTILVGMKMPPNLGLKYTKEFYASFARVAKKNEIPLLPFLLDKVAGDPKLNQADGIHPNEDGHKIVATTVFEFIRSYL